MISEASLRRQGFHAGFFWVLGHRVRRTVTKVGLLIPRGREQAHLGLLMGAVLASGLLPRQRH